MQALVIAAHGSHLNAGSSQPTFDHADTIRAVGAFDEVQESFWKEEPSFREVLRTVDAEEVYVVPLFIISEGYFTEQVIPRGIPPGRVGPRRLGLRRDECDPHHVDSHRYRPDRPLLRAGRDARLDERRHRQAGRIGDRGPGGRAGSGLAVVGHGTERNENSAKAIEYHADRIWESGRFDEVQALFMDEDPEVDDVTDFFESEDIVVVPLFVADGFHAGGHPEDMGLTDDYRTRWDTPADVDGHRIWYSGAVGTEPLMADVVLERAADAGADVDAAIDKVRSTTGGSPASGTDDAGRPRSRPSRTRPSTASTSTDSGSRRPARSTTLLVGDGEPRSVADDELGVALGPRRLRHELVLLLARRRPAESGPLGVPPVDRARG